MLRVKKIAHPNPIFSRRRWRFQKVYGREINDWQNVLLEID